MTPLVLIIEDDAQWAEILCAILTMHGWKTSVVGSMGAATRFLHSTAVDLTLLDLRLPDSDTQSSLDHISTLKALGAGPVVIVTGAPLDSHLLLLARWAGANQVVSKGARGFPQTLIEAIDCPVHA